MTTSNVVTKTSLFFLFFLLFSCCSLINETKETPPVNDVEINRYIGKWYEIARLPNSFEKGLVNVTATYNLLKDGNIQVINEGYSDSPKGKYNRIEGSAWIPDKSVPARLKVSFFWFFASDYIIIELDKENYQYAMVTSSSKDYLWILSRTPEIENDLYTKLVNIAKEKGFDIQKLYKVPQEWN